MKEVSTIKEFVKYNMSDVRNIIVKIFPAVNVNYDLDDVTQHVIERLISQNAVEKFDKKYKVKFSTYVYTCIQNTIRSYYFCKTKNEQFRQDMIGLPDLCFNTKNKASNYTSDDVKEMGTVCISDFNLQLSEARLRLLKLKEEKIKSMARFRIRKNQKGNQFGPKKEKDFLHLVDIFDHMCQGKNITEIAEETDYTPQGIASKLRTIQRNIKSVF